MGERAAEAAIAERLGMMDEMNKAKLRCFLDGKRLGKLQSFYSHWKNIWMNRDLIELYDRLQEEEELKKKAEEELERLKKAARKVTMRRVRWMPLYRTPRRS